MSVLDMDDDDVVDGINEDDTSESDLVGRETWAHICKVRGRNYSVVDEEAWQSLCARRGYVLHRRNPRGF